MGNGKTSENSMPSSQLYAAILKNIPLNVCDRTYPGISSYHPFFICAQDENYVQSICGGDSGSPLVKMSDGIQIALTKGGPIEGCELGKPQLFTSIYPYLGWIGKITGLNVPNC